ncbi:MAG TPA: winged helix-turn-helix domain-containing protein [Blastocatellia bacterium]|nr:winged helix-turn-helix domain-containing protein [Blastocatellia bacterium]
MQHRDGEESVIRFGEFELSLEANELRRGGQAVHLQPQPLKALAFLASRAGQTVTREELRQAVWEGETFVDFEHGLNFCINQIRGALGDKAQSPRFIETLPRRGYRFIAHVEMLNGSPVIKEAEGPVAAAIKPAAPDQAKRRTYRVAWLCVMLIAVAAAGFAGLADAYRLLGMYYTALPAEAYPKAKQAALRAMELDPNNADASVALGTIRFRYEWDWAEAERDFLRALEINPSLGMAHHDYAWFLVAMGRLDEGVEHIEMAQRLDPLSPLANSDVGWVYLKDRPGLRFIARRRAFRAAAKTNRLPVVEPDDIMPLEGEV